MRCVLVVLVVGALGMSACSSNGTHESSPSTAATSTTAGQQSLLQAVAYDSNSSTFATALNVGGLNGRLAARGPFTVFVPANNAFARLTNRRLRALLSPAGKAELAKILEYHVVSGRYLAKDLKAGPLRTLNGATLMVIRNGSNIELADAHGNRAKVLRTDIVVANGVIDVIDGVLLPPS